MDYRPNVAFILQKADKILICERADWPGTWQFPQGGVKDRETTAEALSREVLEELGLPPAAYQIISVKGPYRYRFPKNVKKGGYVGQKQTYFLANLLDESIPFHFGDKNPEFRDARWILPSGFDLESLSPMKRDVYKQVFSDFFGVSL